MTAARPNSRSFLRTRPLVPFEAAVLVLNEVSQEHELISVSLCLATKPRQNSVIHLCQGRFAVPNHRCSFRLDHHRRLLVGCLNTDLKQTADSPSLHS